MSTISMRTTPSAAAIRAASIAPDLSIAGKSPLQQACEKRMPYRNILIWGVAPARMAGLALRIMGTRMSHGYESGRLDLPFVGHCTFGKRPIVTDWDKIDADVAVLGIPYDMGTQYRSGARFGPRAIREASTLFSFGHGGAYDHEDDKLYLH